MKISTGFFCLVIRVGIAAVLLAACGRTETIDSTGLTPPAISLAITRDYCP